MVVNGTERQNGSCHVERGRSEEVKEVRNGTGGWQSSRQGPWMLPRTMQGSMAQLGLCWSPWLLLPLKGMGIRLPELVPHLFTCCSWESWPQDHEIGRDDPAPHCLQHSEEQALYLAWEAQWSTLVVGIQVSQPWGCELTLPPHIPCGGMSRERCPPPPRSLLLPVAAGRCCGRVVLILYQMKHFGD